jgi:hypothetical protein
MVFDHPWDWTLGSCSVLSTHCIFRILITRLVMAADDVHYANARYSASARVSLPTQQALTNSGFILHTT